MSALPSSSAPACSLSASRTVALAVDGVLDAEAVGHLVEHDVGEEGVEVDVAALVLRDQLAGNGNQDLVELGPHRVLQLEPAGTLLELDLFVVGQVDRDGLRPGVGIAGVVDGVIGVEIGVACPASPACMPRGPAAPAADWEASRRSGPASTPILVLYQYKCLV